MPAVLTWKQNPVNDDIGWAANYDTETTAPGPLHEIRFTGSPAIEPRLDAFSTLTVKKLTTDSTFTKAIQIDLNSTLTTYASSLSGGEIVGFGRVQFGREADDGSFHSWIGGAVRVAKIQVGGYAGGASARVEIQSTFGSIGLDFRSEFLIGYLYEAMAEGEVQLRGGTTRLAADNISVSTWGLLNAMVSTTWKDHWDRDNQSTPFFVTNEGEVRLGEGVAFTLDRGGYHNSPAGGPKLVINANATFNAMLNGTTHPATSPGIYISGGAVEMYDGSCTLSAADRDLLVENSAKIRLHGGGRWKHGGVDGQSTFYINAGNGFPGGQKTFKLQNNARLEFTDYNSSWYDPGSATQCGSMLRVTGNMIHGDTSVIKIRGSGSAWDQIGLMGTYNTATIGGTAKLEVVFKGTAPDPNTPYVIWQNVITALSISAASAPYDPEDISTSGSWGTNWSKRSELVGGNSVMLRFDRP